MADPQAAAATAAAGEDGAAEQLPPGAAAGSLPVAEGGGVLSPLSGAYLLIILSEPMSDQHKSRMVQKLRQGELISSCRYIIPPFGNYTANVHEVGI